jgi:hypothetical protein
VLGHELFRGASRDDPPTWLGGNRRSAGRVCQGFDWLADQTQTRPGPEQAEGDEAAETEEAGADLPEFIHLRAATVHAPGTDAVLPETLWRGRLDHVSGWSVGNLGLKPPPRSRAATERVFA